MVNIEHFAKVSYWELHQGRELFDYIKDFIHT